MSTQLLYAVTQDWGSGFQAQMSVVNNGAASLPQWRVAFDYAPSITSIWDARVLSRVGSRYTIGGANWNGDLPASGRISFGFIGSPGNATVGPANIVISSGTSATGGSNRPPLARSDTATVSVGQPVTVSVLANDTDPDGDPLTLSTVAQGKNGSVVKNAGGTVTYTPRAGFSGSDSFTYVVADGRGGSATGTVTISVAARRAWPARVFAPYVDMTAWPTYNLMSAVTNAGVKYFHLAFIVASPAKQAAWGGYASYEIGSAFSNGVRAQVDNVRAAGGDVAISFGGANGQELAQVHTTVAGLKSAYAGVVNAYALSRIDFDIEGAAVADRASVDRRAQAIAALQRDFAAVGRPLQVWFTLPVLPSGLTPDGLNVVQSALRNGVVLSGVNGMAMDYGPWAAPNPQGRMGSYAIDVANSLFAQLQGVYGTQKTTAQLWSMVGITPMIGVNDVAAEIFRLADAQQLLSFATQKGLGQLSMWSLNRDRQAPGGTLSWASSEYSGVLQSPFDFAKIFAQFKT